MNTKQKIALYKNLICASIGLLILFFTSIFVIKGLFQVKIDKLIDEATILKDSKYPTWGQFPGTVDASYTHTVTLYNNTLEQNEPVPLPPITFDYSYDFKNMTFGQGNQGTIKYLNNWERTWAEYTADDLKKQKVSTINLGLEKVSNYEYYSTETRKFVLNFNMMWNGFKEFLPKFYALYLNQFYLHDKEVVSKAIFDVMGTPENSQELVINHWKYGWSNPQNLAVWFKLSHLSPSERLKHAQFELIREACQLSSQDLLNLVGEKSVIFKLSSALNGTVQNKVETNTLNYKGCDPFCTDDQLLSIQMSTGFLTSAPLMGKLTLDKALNELNTSYPFPIEYKKFCDESGMACVDAQNSIEVFNRLVFNNFTKMSKVFENRDNYELIENLFQVQNPIDDGSYGKSLIAYVDYLRTFLFNSYDQEKAIVDESSYKYMFPTHQFLVENINYLGDLLQSQLIAKALINEIQTENITCQDFYSNGYAQYVELCDNEETDLSQADTVKFFVRAYFFQNRALFMNLTGMSVQNTTQFLRLDAKGSLFAEKMQEIQNSIAESAACQNIYCERSQLLAREWGGDKPILQQLPFKYFPSGKIDLRQLDFKERFKKTDSDPRYCKVIGQTLDQEIASKLLDNSNSSVLVLLNLLSYHFKASQNQDQISSKIVRYVQKSVVDSFFGSYLDEMTVEEAIQGFKSDSVEEKRQMNELMGGAPWISSKVSLLETKHQSASFNKMNTGIYDSNRLRSIVEIEEQKMGSSSYKVFDSEYDSVDQTILSNKQVKGSNMLGFHQGISSSEQLTVYLESINYAAKLALKSSDYTFNGNISSMKFAFNSNNENISIGVEQQNQRYVIIDPSSYIVIEPVTGLTLEISLKYTTYSNLSSASLYYSQENLATLKLFDMNIYYGRQNVDSINTIAEVQFEMLVLNIVTVSLAAFSMLLIIIFSVFYIRNRRKSKLDVIESLIQEESKQVV